MYKKLLATLILACSFSANAALITIESANTNFGSNKNVDLASYWAGLDDSDIASESFSSATMLFKGKEFNNSIYKMTINLFPNKDTKFGFFAGLDAGYGAELFHNGNLVTDINSDIWWSRNWNNSQVISEDMMLSAGSNEITFFWAEGNASGGNSFEFALAGERLALSSANLQAQVPAPSTIGIFAMTLIGMSLFGRRKSK